MRLLALLPAVLGAALLAVALHSEERVPGEIDHVRSAVRAPAAAAQTPVQWCGGDRSSTDRTPDVLGSNQVHVVYAIPSDGPDQFGAFVHRIVTDLGTVDTWWRRQDPARTIRFDLAPFAGCTTTAGQIDVSFVRLPRPSPAYLGLGSNLQALATDIGALGFNARTKRYLVYYDGPTTATDVCGTAFRDPTGGGGPEFVAAVWMRSCSGDVGAGNILAATAAHELLHALGVLPRGAPSACRGDDGHPCDSPQDLMYPEVSANFADLVLDVGRDDYYGHAGAWLDVQDSRWLMRADVPPSALTVAVRQRSAQDRVTSDPVGLSCPSSCAVLFDTGSQVRLTATSAAGSRFTGWGGACAGAAESCTVTMDAAKTVEASFGPSSFRLTLGVVGRGVTRAPVLALSCARRCSTAVDANAVVRIRATATRGWRFLRWSGACGGRGPCAVRMSAARSVTAVFQRIRRR